MGPPFSMDSNQSIMLSGPRKFKKCQANNVVFEAENELLSNLGPCIVGPVGFANFTINQSLEKSGPLKQTWNPPKIWWCGSMFLLFQGGYFQVNQLCFQGCTHSIGGIFATFQGQVEQSPYHPGNQHIPLSVSSLLSRWCPFSINAEGSKLLLFPHDRGWENHPNSRGLYTHFTIHY